MILMLQRYINAYNVCNVSQMGRKVTWQSALIYSEQIPQKCL